MNRLTNEKRVAVVKCLCEGLSIRSTVRMTGVAKNTIVKLLAEIGEACNAFQDKTLRKLPCQRIQCDEIWSFVGAKAKNVPREKRGQFGIGDVWTWTALCADTKLIVSWRVGDRDAGTAHEFTTDLAARLANRVQLTSDGHSVYLNAIEAAFGANVDYAMLVKLYGADGRDTEATYSPQKLLAAAQFRLLVTRTRSTFRPATLNARISQCGCQCAVSHGLQMLLQKRWRITSRPCRFTSCITTSAACIRLCVLPRQWKQESQIMFGALKKSSLF